MSNQKKTALYCRLSQDDGLDGDSNSIQNRKRASCKSCRRSSFSKSVQFKNPKRSAASGLEPAHHMAMPKNRKPKS